MSCKKAQEFLGPDEFTVNERVDGKKVKFSPGEVPAILARVKKVVAARGKSITRFDLVRNPPDETTLLSHLIGPSGNLRAPTAIVGQTLYVGFNPEMYKELSS
ncbi:MAG: hypothetical protein EXS09_19180 [Gemmataceae bacterium]|nr:hypothetical protein [Gemmataceae bacterium]